MFNFLVFLVLFVAYVFFGKLNFSEKVAASLLRPLIRKLWFDGIYAKGILKFFSFFFYKATYQSVDKGWLEFFGYAGVVYFFQRLFASDSATAGRLPL